MNYYDDHNDLYDNQDEYIRQRRLRAWRRRVERERQVRRRRRILAVVLSAAVIAAVCLALFVFPKILDGRKAKAGGNTASAAAQEQTPSSGPVKEIAYVESAYAPHDVQAASAAQPQAIPEPASDDPYVFTYTDQTKEIPLSEKNIARMKQRDQLAAGTAETAGEQGTESAEGDAAAAAAGETAEGSEEVLEDLSQITDSAPVVGNDYVDSFYAILVNADDGTVIAERDSRERMVPASMTKVMTVLVACENLTEAQLDDTFTVTQEICDLAFLSGASNVGYSPGDNAVVRDLLYGTVLESGGDAAMSLAEYVAGSQDAFVALMNEKLEELGLSGSAHFTNCIGLYDENHYCTVYDMAVIMAAAMDNEMAKGFLGMHTWTTSPMKIYPEGREISNWFLRRIEDKDTHGLVIGAKTGYVNESGSCAVSMQMCGDGTRYICCTGNAWSGWRCIYDHVAMYSEYTH